MENEEKKGFPKIWLGIGAAVLALAAAALIAMPGPGLERTVGRNLRHTDITEFSYIYDDVDYPARYQKYRFYTEGGKHYFSHETREKDDYGPLTEQDITEAGVSELTAEEWNAFLEELDGGTVKKREVSAEAGDPGPWTYLYWTGDRSGIQQFSFPTVQAEKSFEGFCITLKDVQEFTAEKEAEAAERKAAEEAEAAAKQQAEEALAAGDPAEINYGGGTPWIDSCLAENIREDMTLSPKEDFYLFVNYDWARKKAGKNGGGEPDAESGPDRAVDPNAGSQGLPQGGTAGEKELSVQEIIAKEMREILEDDQAESHEMELLQDYYRAFKDWDTRNWQGVEPLRRVAEDIKNLKDLNELSAFLADESRSGDVPMPVRIVNFVGPQDPKHYVTDLNVQAYADLLLQDPDEYKNRSKEGEKTYQSARRETLQVLRKLGWDQEEAEKCFEDFCGVETLLSSRLYSLGYILSGQYNQVYEFAEIPELKKWMQAYPIEEILLSRGFGASKKILYDNKEYLQLIGEIYTPLNFERFRSYYLVRYILENDWTCDEASYVAHLETFDEEFEENGVPEDYAKAYELLKGSLPNAMDQAYLARHDASKERQEIIDLFEEIRTVYRDMLAGETWLSEETRANVLKKLDTMKIFALYPDHQVDFSSLDFKGKSFAEIYRETGQFLRDREKLLVESAIDPEENAWKVWSMLDDNAKMMRESNAVLITLGMLKEKKYHSGLGKEELYGAVGHVIAHEMSHGFDRLGMRFDWEGNMDQTRLWTEEEEAEFQKRSEKLRNYYDSIVPFEGYHCSGQLYEAEATADLTGFSAIMKLAELEPEFDYNVFFRGFAASQRVINSYAGQVTDLTDDPHPFNYLRCNVVVQQFDKFNETYDVRPGDTMYLKPEDRIFVW